MTLSGISDWIHSFFTSMLNHYLPNRTKRLVFLASLTARLKETQSPDTETISKLNRAMELAKSDSAIKLPYELSRAIWHGKTSYQIFNADISQESLHPIRVKEMSTSVLLAMPSWLRYGSDTDMEQDVSKLLDRRSMVF